MAPHHQAYFYAIGASAVFSAASLLYAHYSKKISSLWMTFFKAVVCFAGMLITVIVMNAWQPLGGPYVAALMLSGLLGLGIGDLFLLQAYARMGAGRTLVLYGFQPLFLGVASYYLFHQDFNGYRLVAILFFLICLFLFSLEKFKEHGHWEVVGLIAALLGVLFDNVGVILTRWTFEAVPEPHAAMLLLIGVSGAFLSRRRSAGRICPWRRPAYECSHSFGRNDPPKSSRPRRRTRRVRSGSARLARWR